MISLDSVLILLILLNIVIVVMNVTVVLYGGQVLRHLESLTTVIQQQTRLLEYVSGRK